LGIKHYIVEIKERTILRVLKDMVIKKTRIIIMKGIETIIHSFHYKITMLNVINETIMVTKLVIVDYQSIPLRLPTFKKKSIKRHGK
jgi:hypothetical protein